MCENENNETSAASGILCAACSSSDGVDGTGSATSECKCGREVERGRE